MKTAERTVLFHTFFLDLTQGKVHIHGASSRSKTTLSFTEDICNVDCKPIANTLPATGRTDTLVSFPLSGGILF